MHRSFVLRHSTSYRYDRAVRLGPQLLRLRPRPDPRAPFPCFRLDLDPVPSSLHWMLDPLGNAVARLGFTEPLERLDISVRLALDLRARNPFDFLLDREVASWPFSYAPADRQALSPFLEAAPLPALDAIRDASRPGQETVGMVMALAAAVRNRVAYVVRDEPGVWEPERTLAEARGSCRDSAWLLVWLLRRHGIAARFVSGYLLQLGAEGADPPGEGELHAWAELFLPGAGWLGVDATSGFLAAEGHVALAVAVDPAGAAPLQGTMEVAGAVLTTSTTLERLEV